jgi:F-type H+-transporting ATPase subunit delta
MKDRVLASRYVLALENVVGESELESVYEQLISISDAFITSNAWSSLQSPVLDIAKKKELIKALCSTLKTNSVIENFFYVLLDKNRIQLLPTISKQASERLSDLKKEILVLVEADQGFSSKDEARLSQYVANQTKKNVKLELKRVDDSLGGFKAYVDNVVYDGSVESALDKLKLSFN